jgi:hypothetical protein
MIHQVLRKDWVSLSGDMVGLIVVKCKDVTEDIIAPQKLVKWFEVEVIDDGGRIRKLLMKYDLSDMDIELLKIFLSGRCE